MNIFGQEIKHKSEYEKLIADLENEKLKFTEERKSFGK